VNRLVRLQGHAGADSLTGAGATYNARTLLDVQEIVAPMVDRQVACVYFVTHPEVEIDPMIPVSEWPLSPRGRERMRALLKQPWLQGIRTVWCSTERKALDGAEIIGNAIGSKPRSLATLNENDRAATGYLPKAEFEATADAFFANPLESVRGWEKAADAQVRIVAAIRTILTDNAAGGDIAVVSHGGVGALLLCWLKSCPIGRTEDQPGEGGGNYYCFERDTYSLRHDWLPIDVVNS
jgi:broad specificity phosphatase PhoE